MDFPDCRFLMCNDKNLSTRLWERVSQWYVWVQSHPIVSIGAALVVFSTVLLLLLPNLTPRFILDLLMVDLQQGVETATGILGLGIIAIYSFLIAFILPLPSEIVLVAPVTLGLSQPARLALIMIVSGIGKAAGSVVALRVGMTAKKSGLVLRSFKRLGIDIADWSRRTSIKLVKRYGYVGMAMALSVPFFPDTASIYAFSVLEDNYQKFALAAFIGSVTRLLITVLFIGGTIGI